MDRFFITGLPRSRTAWLSVVAMAAGRVCTHEPSAVFPFKTIKANWRPGDGVSDSGLGIHLQEIVDTLGPRTLIVQRDIRDVMTSARCYFGDSLGNDWSRVESGLDQLSKALAVDHPLIKRVGYSELTNVSVAAECMNWLGVKPVGLEQLQHFNVQSDLAWNLGMIARRAA